MEKIKEIEKDAEEYATKRSIWDDYDEDDEKIKDGPIVIEDDITEYIDID